MRTYIFDTTGNFIQKDITRSEVVSMFNVNVRDLRPILIKKQVTTLFRRNDALIVNIRDIKIILDDRKALLFFENENQEARIVEFFQSKGQDALANTTFELFMIEQAFGYVFQKITHKFSTIKKLLDKTLKKLSEKPTDEYFEELLNLKRKIGKIETQMENIEELLQELLEPENISELALQKTTTDKQLDEIESVIENLYEQSEMINENIDEINENLEDTQQILTLKIGTRRNTIIRFDLIVSFVAAVFGFLAVITGFYGMNIRNHAEQNDNAFLIIALLLVLILIGAIISAWLYLRKNKIL
jgi:Mg2+ and Co2+ transporter CorA